MGDDSIPVGGWCSYRVVGEFNHMCEHNIILLP